MIKIQPCSKKMEKFNFDGFISEYMAYELTDFLEAYKGQQVEVKLNSIGGYVSVAFKCYNAIQEHGNVRIMVVGDCMSAAVLLLCAAKEVYASPLSLFMMHKPHGLVEGNSDDLARELEVRKKIEGIMAKAIAKKTGKAIDQVISTYLADNDTYLTAEEALSVNLIDRIIDLSDDLTAVQQRVNLVACKAEGYKFHLPNVLKSNFNKPKPKPKPMEKDVKELLDMLGASSLADAKAKAEVAVTQLKAAKQSAVDALINGAIEAGKITDEQKEAYRKLAASNFEAAQEVLKHMPVVAAKTNASDLNINSLLNRQPPGSGAVGTDTNEDWDDLRRNNPKKLKAIKMNEPEKYNKLVAAYMQKKELV